MEKLKSILIYIFLTTFALFLFASFEAQNYYEYINTANIKGKYMYSIFVDDLENVPKSFATVETDEVKKASYEIGDNSKFLTDYKFILYYMDYMSYPETTIFDEEMSRAVNAYKVENNLSNDSILDTLTMNMLEKEILTYKLGQRGERIYKYQLILQKLGYIPEEEGLNGTFGEVTAYAVKSYQADRGLEQTSTLDIATMADLDNDNYLLLQGYTPEEIKTKYIEESGSEEPSPDTKGDN